MSGRICQEEEEVSIQKKGKKVKKYKSLAAGSIYLNEAKQESFTGICFCVEDKIGKLLAPISFYIKQEQTLFKDLRH